MKLVPVRRAGFTLIETLVSLAVFILVAVAMYPTYITVVNAARVARVHITATALANEQFEIVRNLAYADVGIENGLPEGVIPHTQTLIRDGKEFTVITTIRNIDDPFDGLIGQSPNDLSPADYKLVEVEIACPTCRNFSSLRFTTQVAPLGLETASTNGALFVQVFDAAGEPIQGADVHIENNQTVPAIIIDDTTNNDGMLQIVDAPPGAEAYEITVSKDGYSSERTYLTGAPENPNPAKPHATVAVQQVTQISFLIDLVSSFDVSSLSMACASAGNTTFSLSGAKAIGTNPTVLKYDEDHTTGGSGLLTIPDLEWDAYALTFTDASYDLLGTIPTLPLILNPNINQELKLVVGQADPDILVVTVKDTGTQLPLSDASVQLSGGGYDETFFTGQGFLRQTDWSGGPGQENFSDPTQYLDADVTMDVITPAGEIRLNNTDGEYAALGTLTSSAFDTGSASNFHQLLWLPESQPGETGAESVRFQVATNNDGTTWNFVGPDGTASTFYTVAGTNFHTDHDNDRYLRYKAYLQTASTTFSPTIGDVSFTFTSECVPPGQVYFEGLSPGDYTLTVAKDGYQPLIETVTMSSSWQEHSVLLSP